MSCRRGIPFALDDLAVLVSLVQFSRHHNTHGSTAAISQAEIAALERAFPILRQHLSPLADADAPPWEGLTDAEKEADCRAYAAANSRPIDDTLHYGSKP